MDNFLENIKNNIDFFLRQRLPFSRKNYCAKNEGKEDLFLNYELKAREQLLVEKYSLEYLKSNSTRQNYLENLYIIDILEQTFDIDFRENMSVLDIGCKNWFYAKGEHSFFKKHCKKLKLDGIELDTNRLYNDFYSRGEVAKFNIKDLTDTNYISGDFLTLDKKYDFLVWILPFVVEYPHIRWGLPKKYFQPEKMLQHALNSLNPGGRILVINQGEIEYNKQQELCKILGADFTALGEIKSDFLDYKYSRFATIIKYAEKT